MWLAIKTKYKYQLRRIKLWYFLIFVSIRFGNFESDRKLFSILFLKINHTVPLYDVPKEELLIDYWLNEAGKHKGFTDDAEGISFNINLCVPKSMDGIFMDYLNLIKVGTRVEPLALFVLTNQYIWKLKGNERVRCNISVKNTKGETGSWSSFSYHLKFYSGKIRNIKPCGIRGKLLRINP